MSEVQRTKALLQDAIRTFAEPATTYSQEAAADIVIEALRLYRRALQAQVASQGATGEHDAPPTDDITLEEPARVGTARRALRGS